MATVPNAPQKASPHVSHRKSGGTGETGGQRTRLILIMLVVFGVLALFTWVVSQNPVPQGIDYHPWIGP